MSIEWYACIWHCKVLTLKVKSVYNFIANKLDMMTNRVSFNILWNLKSCRLSIGINVGPFKDEMTKSFAFRLRQIRKLSHGAFCICKWLRCPFVVNIRLAVLLQIAVLAQSYGNNARLFSIVHDISIGKRWKKNHR